MDCRHKIHPPGIEPGLSVPETDVISVLLWVRFFLRKGEPRKVFLYTASCKQYRPAGEKMIEENSETGRKIVIKIGSGVLTRGPEGGTNDEVISGIARSICAINAKGHRCVVVSSGAVAAGLSSFQLDSRPKELEMLQACAAAGQARLMHVYEDQFRVHKLKVAQLLLTHEGLRDESRRNNVLGTLTAILRFSNVIPIINENDSVAVEELRFGDNDVLSSTVAQLIKADQFILLTTVPGLRGHGATHENDIITEVNDINTVMDFATGEKGANSVGGMETKLKAVKSAVDSGIETFIASGLHPEQLLDLVEGKGIGTRFKAS